MRRPIRSRPQAQRVATRLTNDVDALFAAARNDGTSPIQDDEVIPILNLRRKARKVRDLLNRDVAGSPSNSKV